MIGFSSTTPTIFAQNQRVGINCASPNASYALHVVGDVGIDGQISVSNATISNSVNSCSDIRYKKNIVAIENPLDKLTEMRGVFYDWKTTDFPEKHFSDNRQLGFIAQEIEVLFPEIVHTDEDGYKSVDYSRLTPILVEAMKAQQTEIAALKNENQNLNNKVEGFEKALEDIKTELGKNQLGDK